MTLVMAKDRTPESIREALKAGRTVAWASKYLAGKEENVRNLFNACVKLLPSHFSQENRNGILMNYYEIQNNSDLYFELELTSGKGSRKITLYPMSSQLISAEADQQSISYDVTNAYIRSDKYLNVSFFMTTENWIQLSALLITSIGIILTLVNNNKHIKNFNKQLKLNFFADYTRRYQEIILNFPMTINKKSFNYDDLPTDEKNKTLRYMRAYFDLCSEEFDLWRTGYIEDRIWKNWNERIELTFSKQAFMDAWEIISRDTIYNPDFTNWINIVISKNKEKNN
jgi:hypothetical protein